MRAENGRHIAEGSLLLSFVLITATLGFSQAFSVIKPSHEGGKHQEIPVQIYRDYLVIVQGSLVDTHELNFILDTGTNPTIVDSKIAEELHMVGMVGRLAVHDQDVEVQRSVLPSLQIGSLRTESLAVLIRDLSFLQKGLGIRIDAVIGLDVLSQRDFSINYAKKRIVFGTVHLTGSAAPFQSTRPWLIVRIEVDGVSLRLLLDTAASGILLFQRSIRDRLPHLTSLGERTSSNMGGEFVLKRVLLTKTSLDETNFGQQTAFVVEDEEDKSRDFDGLLGPCAFGLKQIAFDFQHQTFSWKR